MLSIPRRIYNAFSCYFDLVVFVSSHYKKSHVLYVANTPSYLEGKVFNTRFWRHSIHRDTKGFETIFHPGDKNTLKFSKNIFSKVNKSPKVSLLRRFSRIFIMTTESLPLNSNMKISKNKNKTKPKMDFVTTYSRNKATHVHTT